MAFRGDIESLILATLADGPKHGYDIAKEILLRSSKLLKYGEGQLYPALHKLEDMGLVRAEWVQQEGKPNRKIYELTDEGRGRLEVAKSEWEEFAAGVAQVFQTKERGHA